MAHLYTYEHRLGELHEYPIAWPASPTALCTTEGSARSEHSRDDICVVQLAIDITLCVFPSPSELLVTTAFIPYGLEPVSHEGVPVALDALFLIFFVILATPRTSFFTLLVSFLDLLVSFFPPLSLSGFLRAFFASQESQ